MFDLLFIYESFVDALPADYHSFKQALRGTKRDFYDTKFMAAAANGQL